MYILLIAFIIFLIAFILFNFYAVKRVLAMRLPGDKIDKAIKIHIIVLAVVVLVSVIVLSTLNW